MSNCIKYRRIILISAITILLTSCYIREHKGILLQHYSGDRLPPHIESTLHFRANLDVQVDGKGFKEMNVIDPGWGDTTRQFIVHDGAVVLRPGLYKIKSIKRDREKTRAGNHYRYGRYIPEENNCGTVGFYPGASYRITYDRVRCLVMEYNRKDRTRRCIEWKHKCVIKRIVR